MRERIRPRSGRPTGEAKKAVLLLEDGTVFQGVGFGAEIEVSGEVVFNTSMYGYPELLTDPSYYDQIVVMTYPIIGSYGVPSRSLSDQHGLPLHFESDSVKVKGYAVHSLSNPSHWSSERTLQDWLESENVPGISGIDTRALTRKLRTNGTMLGTLKVTSGELGLEQGERGLKKMQDPNQYDLVRHVSPTQPISYMRNNGTSIVIVDCGAKFGIVRELLAKGVSVVRVPYDYSLDQILAYNPHGIVISNGPGDPAKCEKTIETTGQIINDTKLPVMGICLGSQILGLAAGGSTFKLKFGHRAVNHPCVDLKTGRCYITTQNHGYTVDENSIKDTDFEVSFVNINDKTVEGIRHKKKRIIGVQWHPESSPGPHDTQFLFAEFLGDARRLETN